jgi:hypothetical protein
MQARGLLDSNPTRAAAVLKELPETSTQLGEARAVAQAAIVRGAAWTIDASPELIVFAELSPDARSLLQVSRGAIRVWDLDRRRAVFARSYPRAHALWVGNRLLVGSDRPELVDPFAATAEPLAVGPMTSAVATLGGDRVAYLDDHGAANLLDIATRTAQPLWPGHHPGEIEIAADGSWIALADKTTVAVLDATGRELTSRRARVTRLFGSRFDEVGYATLDHVAICKLQPEPVWSEVDLAAQRPAIAVDFVFRGHELDIYLAGGSVMAWNGRSLRERIKLGGFMPRLLEAGRDLVIAPGTDGKLHFANALVRGELHLPMPLDHLRVTARAGAPRVVAVGDGRIVGFDLADSLPEDLDRPLGTFATFVDDDTVLFWRNDGGEWQWYDLRTKVATPFGYDPHGIPGVIEVDPDDGRVLIRELSAEPSLILLRKGTTEQRTIARGRSPWGRLLPHGTLLFGVGDGRVLAAGADGAPREIAKLDGTTETGVGLGGTRFAAISSTGELVRGDLAGGTLERARIRPGAGGALAADRSGRVIVAADNRLALWDRDLVELTRLDQAIVRIVPIDDGALLELADHAIVRSPLTAGSPVQPVMRASSKPPLISGDARLIVAETVNAQVAITELPTGATWELPAYYASYDLVAISPSTRHFIQSGFGQMAMWTLPLAPPELRGWLDEHTNVTADEREPPAPRAHR